MILLYVYNNLILFVLLKDIAKAGGQLTNERCKEIIKDGKERDESTGMDFLQYCIYKGHHKFVLDPLEPSTEHGNVLVICILHISLDYLQWNLCILDTMGLANGVLIIEVSWFSYICGLCRRLHFQVSWLTGSTIHTYVHGFSIIHNLYLERTI